MTNPPVPRAATWDELQEHVARCLHAGYQATGAWSLAQVCRHLTDWLTYPIDGFPPQPWFVRGLMWLLRHTVAPGQLSVILQSGIMPAGQPTILETIHRPEDDESAAVEAFVTAMERFRRHPGPWQPSPLFGMLDRGALESLQLIHCRHHLAFLKPREE
jgi:hypothetical protein